MQVLKSKNNINSSHQFTWLKSWQYVGWRRCEKVLISTSEISLRLQLFNWLWAQLQLCIEKYLTRLENYYYGEGGWGIWSWISIRTCSSMSTSHRVSVADRSLVLMFRMDMNWSKNWGNDIKLRQDPFNLRKLLNRFLTWSWAKVTALALVKYLSSGSLWFLRYAAT